jgi:hypothetical protein
MVTRHGKKALVAAGQWDPQRVRPHHGQGRCVNCYQRARRGPNTSWPRTALLEEVSFIVEGGNASLPSIAQRLGIKQDTLTLALRRAERAGDTTAGDLRARLNARRVA